MKKHWGPFRSDWKEGTMKCELCGTDVKVVRKTTQHYERTHKEYLRAISRVLRRWNYNYDKHKEKMVWVATRDFAKELRKTIKEL